MWGWLIPLIIVAGLVIWLVVSYNRLIALREQVRTAWAQIEVLLKRRHDLIPNLVETVKGYASHERGTLEAVIQARNAAVSTAAPRQGPSSGSDNPAQQHQKQIEAENQLSGTLSRLFALSESYPQLKADASFMSLQNELSDTENRISGGRQSYNNTVRGYNTTLQSIPTNLIAGVFGFSVEPFFEVQNQAEREVPKVQF